MSERPMFARPTSCTHGTDLYPGEFIVGENWPYFTCGCRADVIPKERIYDPVKNDRPWRRNVGLPIKLFWSQALYRFMKCELSVDYFLMKKSLSEDGFSFNVLCKNCVLPDKDKTYNIFEREQALSEWINARCFPNGGTLSYRVELLFHNTSNDIVLSFLKADDFKPYTITCYGGEDGVIWLPCDNRPGHHLRSYMIASAWAQSAYREIGVVGHAVNNLISASHRHFSFPAWRYPNETHCRICSECVFDVKRIEPYDSFE